MMGQRRRGRQQHAERNNQTDSHLDLLVTICYCAVSQRPRVFPSANFAAMNWPAWVPSRIGLKRMVTCAPGSNVPFFHPCRDNVLGLPPSKLHSSLVPALSTFT